MKMKMKMLIEATNYRDRAQSKYEHQSCLKDFYSNKDLVAGILVVTVEQHWSNHCAVPYKLQL